MDDRMREAYEAEAMELDGMPLTEVVMNYIDINTGTGTMYVGGECDPDAWQMRNNYDEVSDDRLLSFFLGLGF